MLSLPTDNLYKFAFFSGLMLMWFALYLPYQKEQELWVKAENL
jgi:hypothetical protein